MRIAEIGCGAGKILDQLSKRPYLKDVQFSGYDISSQAIDLCKWIDNKNVTTFHGDLLAENNADYFDILLVIDVFEHVPNYMEFVEKCRHKAKYKIFHIPLDIHVSSVLRNSVICNRYSIGHLHYFSAESAIVTLQDTGHKIMDYFYTNGALALFKQHPSIRAAIANGPRWLFSKFSVPFSARIFGGYSLLVLTE